MRYNEIGINIDSVDKLVLDIYNYAERISKTLDQISNVVDQTKNFYECDVATEYRKKFNSFRTNFAIIDRNVKSYASDLIKLKNRYKTIDAKVVGAVKRATISLESEIK